MTPPFLNSFANSDIQELFTVGDIQPNVDMYGNLNLISGSTVISASIIGFPLEKQIYDVNYIRNYYITNFTEFTVLPVSSSITPNNQVADLQSTLQTTQDQLNLTTIQLNNVLSKNSQLGGLQAEQSASMALAISLRIQLGQGSSSGDFQSNYPWLPINSYPSSSTTSVNNAI